MLWTPLQGGRYRYLGVLDVQGSSCKLSCLTLTRLRLVRTS